MVFDPHPIGLGDVTGDDPLHSSEILGKAG